MTRKIDTHTPNPITSAPATVAACQGDRANRPGSVSDITGERRTATQVDTLRAAEAVIQRGLVAGEVTR